MIKQHLNLWVIWYKDEDVIFSTVFNSGFIDDINIVKEYFIKNNPNYSEIKIEKA